MFKKAFNKQYLDSIVSKIHSAKMAPHSFRETKVLNNKKAAVLIPFCNCNGVASVLFTLRSKHVSTHKGEVSFPGGHLDEGETAVMAALREAREELGENDLGEIDILAVFPDIPSKNGTLVTPVLGYIHKDLEDFSMLHPNEHEVEKVFSRPIELLCSPSYQSHENFTTSSGHKLKAPVFGGGEEHLGFPNERIWGMTAFVLDSVLKRCFKE